MKHYFEQREKVLEELETSDQGLSEAVAKERLERDGKNKLTDSKHVPTIVKLFAQMKDSMVLVLIGAALLSGLFGEIADMLIIFVVIILNAILGVVQENKAEKAMEALQHMSSSLSRVRRNGVVSEIKSEDIVVGDIVLFEAGDAIPADLRILQSASLKIEEAALTGESIPAEKIAESLELTEEDVMLNDRLNMGYMGTSAVYGRGEGVVIATGMGTEMGKIANILTGTKEEKTPLQQKLASLSKVLSIGVLGICIFIFIVGVIRNGGFGGGHVFEMLLTAVSLAVAAIPEGLVAVVTVLLSIGMTKMSKQHAIIRKLTAVETLGCTQVICSDKTGTITQNKMSVVDVFGDKMALAKGMTLCTDVQVGESGELVGEPTEIGLVAFGSSLQLSKAALERENPRLAEAPFDSVRKMMTTIHQGKDGLIKQYTKGAPDEILKRCTSILLDGSIQPFTDTWREKVLQKNKEMADKALRVLALASLDLEEVPTDVTPENVEKSLVFIGLVGMIDPVRPEVRVAMEQCKTAGIRTVMITGDHKDTAVAIAKDLGMIQHTSEAMTGAELMKITDEEFEQKVENISVYARVQPEDKVRIVKMWQKKGKITAMTGDGVNDAPALKTANIGVGMGITGTDVTKNVAEMVLADDNFATIVSAVKKGRRIYENIRKAIQFLLSANLSEVVAIFIATMAGFVLFSPIHILWINLVTDTFPAMALGMEEAEADSMEQPPRPKNEGIFAGRLGIDIVYQGIVIALLTLLSFFIGEGQSHPIGMTMAFLTLSMSEVFHSLNLRSRTKSIFQVKTHNKFLFGAMVLSTILTIGVIYLPGVNTVFRLVPLSGADFFVAVGLAFLIIPIVEIVKWFERVFLK